MSLFRTLSPRITAFLLHLFGSLLLATFALALVFLVWYPSPLATALGVGHIFLLMLGIDVIVGPLFTLLVYKVGKKTLKFDLTTIVVLQLCVFSYGLYTVAQGRPAWIAFNTTGFVVVRTADIDPTQVENASSEYQHAPWFGPKWVAVHMPNDAKLANKIMFDALRSGVDMATNPSLYQPVASEAAAIHKKAEPLSKLNAFNPPDRVQAVLSEWPNAQHWIPLWCTMHNMVVLLDANDHVITIVDLHPWNAI